jgi:hypothetical protein
VFCDVTLYSSLEVHHFKGTYFLRSDEQRVSRGNSQQGKDSRQSKLFGK